MLRALVFDFDGLILDTETPEYVAWSEIFRAHGTELTLEEWSAGIGTAGVVDPLALLAERSSIAFDPAEIQIRRRSRSAELINRELPLPGVLRIIEEARELGWKLAVASSSSRDWVNGHLKTHRLDHFFDAIATSDDVDRVKPDPALYRLAVERLDVQPDEAAALEDSLNGIRAARTAGLHCVAVPNGMTRHLPFAEADLVLESLEHLSLSRLSTGTPASPANPNER